MNKEIIDHIIEAVNLAEQLAISNNKKQFVLDHIAKIFPDMDVMIVSNCIEILVHISKVSDKLLINQNQFNIIERTNKDCCNML